MDFPVCLNPVFKTRRLSSSQMLDEGMLAPAVYNSETLRFELQPMLLEPVLKNYNLLICFKKDAHKMETFLKLLKCRQTDNLNCASL